jgi:type IV pilus assembly protein PilQ
MGSVTRRRSLWVRRPRAAIALLSAVSLSLACGSGGSPGPRSAPEPAAAERASAAAPVEVTGLELTEVAPGARLEIVATGPLVWTQYRDVEGRLVLELPNSQAAPQVSGITPVSGLVEEVALEALSEAERPLLRLVIATREEAEHELVAEGGILTLTLMPIAQPGRLAFAYEPLPEGDSAAALAPPALAPEPPAVAAAPPPEPSAPPAPRPRLGTPEDPYVAPAPRSVAASRLQSVEVDSSERLPMVWIHGDGEFAYSTFQLGDPPRFVIDLHGVVNLAPRGVVSAPHGVLERVRVAQFKPQPEPVSRVVLDLREMATPQVLRTEEGLLVSFLPEEPLVATPPARPEPERPARPPLEELQDEPAVARAWDEMPPPEVVEPLPEPPAAPRVEAPRAEAPRGPPHPAPGARPAPQPSDVALFEAMDVQDAPLAWEAPQVQTFETREVAAAERRYQGEPVSFSLRDADLVEVLRTFARISGLNMVVQPGVRGSVTVEIDNVPWDQALDLILRMNGLDYDLEGNIMRIAPRALLAQEAREEAERRTQAAMAVPLRTVMKRISYAEANEVASLLRSPAAAVLSARGSVAIDRRTNTLIIKELPDFMDSVLAIIDQIDVPEPQVIIEARIVETSKRFSRTLGIQWGFQAFADPAHGNTTGLVFPSNIATEGGVNLLTGGRHGFIDLSLGNVLDSFRLDMVLQAAESEGLVNILSSPKVATLNNQRATIQSGLQIPVQTVANNTVTVQFVNATLRLNVTPQVTAEGTVMMDIDIQKREPQLAFAVVGATNAPISTKEARTRVIVRDGGTTVIGGIYEVSTDFGEDRVPGLANIPVLGHLFRNRRRSTDNEELLIFITPRVIKL